MACKAAAALRVDKGVRDGVALDVARSLRPNHVVLTTTALDRG